MGAAVPVAGASVRVGNRVEVLTGINRDGVTLGNGVTLGKEVGVKEGSELGMADGTDVGGGPGVGSGEGKPHAASPRQVTRSQRARISSFSVSLRLSR